MVKLTQVAQAVLLHFPYLQEVRHMDVRELYARAVVDKVPFHIWHQWVEGLFIK